MKWVEVVDAFLKRGRADWAVVHGLIVQGELVENMKSVEWVNRDRALLEHRRAVL